MSARVINLRSRRGYAPDLVSLTCSRVREARNQAGLSISEFAATLQPLLGWTPKPGMIRAWETDVEPPGSVVLACDLLSKKKPASSATSYTDLDNPHRDDPVSMMQEGDALVVPCRTIDGRITCVSIPRRVFLAGGLGAAALTAITKAAELHIPGTQAALRMSSVGTTDQTPIEHLQQLRRALVESDNLFGPWSVLP